MSLRASRDDVQAPDIAIASVGTSFSDIHMKSRGKVPIDLDNWSEPDWMSLRSPVAFGYPSEHKSRTLTFVGAPFVGVAAELARPISPGDGSFMMASTLDTENSFFFSGLSGGAVYAVVDSDLPLTAIGIVFEGTPGSSAAWEARDAQSFYTKSDIQIRAHTLTPRTFEEWLRMASAL